ncbi:hypothetical protein BSKO_13955 [Bryopsis sp. KO-2023]|nr:hypothetical protein BSKO_13955 [Bryopsis sp. KO-2023]
MAAPVKLAANKKEREKFDNLADLFAIIKTTERLERGYVRDDISAQDYEPACQKLIAQYRTLWNSIRNTVPDVERFMAKYSMQCPMAAARLLQSGVPATIEHGRAEKSNASAAKNIAQTVANFITAMDSIKLGMVAVDDIQPLLREILQSMNNLSDLPPDFPAKERVRSWTTKLHNHPANYELPEEDKRQLMYDLEISYNDINASWESAR